MSMSLSIAGAIIPQETTESIWIADAPSPQFFDEGDTVRFTLTCRGPVPGKSKLKWKIAGGRAGGGWSKDWWAAWNDACQGRGMTVSRLSGYAEGATIALLFEAQVGYDGQPIHIDNTCLKNRITDSGSADNLVWMYMQLVIPDGFSGYKFGDGVPFAAHDISKTPPGSATLNLSGQGRNGGPFLSAPPEGYPFELVLRSEHLAPGTKLLLYAANVAQGKLTPSFRGALKAAAEAKGCQCATDYGTVGPYNGGIITVGVNYDDDDPIVIPLALDEDHTTTGVQQLDFILNLKEEGNPVKPLQIGAGVVSMFIRDTSVEPTATWWRIDGYRDDTGLHYSLTSPSGVTPASIDLQSYGDVPAGFAAALTAAIGANSELSMTGSTISCTGSWNGALAWSCPNPGGTGKHSLRLSNPQPQNSKLVIADACVFFAQPVLAPQPTFVSGVNLSGGEFGDVVPGEYATDYRYPAFPEWGDYRGMQYFVDKGCKIVRLTCKWPRIQRTMFGELSSDGDISTWSGALDMDRIDDIIRWETSRGVIVLLDVHDYLRAFGSIVGPDTSTPTEALTDLWVRLANRYAANPLVWFGIMNEPNGILATTTVDIMTAVVNGIRARTSALNRVLVTGPEYSGGWSWTTYGSADAFRAYRDPADNHLIEIHQYPDSDSSGTHAACTVGSSTRLDEVTAWARSSGHRLFCGEIGGGDPAIDGNQACGAEVPGMLATIDGNRDVWAGFTAWSGGGRWGPSYIYVLDPADLGRPVDTGQLKLFLPYIKRVD